MLESVVLIPVDGKGNILPPGCCAESGKMRERKRKYHKEHRRPRGWKCRRPKQAAAGKSRSSQPHISVRGWLLLLLGAPWSISFNISTPVAAAVAAATTLGAVVLFVKGEFSRLENIDSPPNGVQQ